MASSFAPVEVHPDDRSLIASLATLEEMHHQVNHLRTFLPAGFLGPVLATIRNSPSDRDDPTPAELYSHWERTVRDGLESVESFKRAWNSEDMHTLRETTKTARIVQGSDTWTGNYLALAKELKEAQEQAEVAVEPTAVAEEDSKAVVKAFQAQNRRVKIEAVNEAVGCPLRVKVAGISFQIDKTGGESQENLSIQARDASKLSDMQQQILRCLEARTEKKSLSFLLSMIASYADVKTRNCDKCLMIIDNQLQFPVIRSPKLSVQPESQQEFEWSAYHRACT